MLANIRVDLRKDRQTDTERFFFSPGSMFPHYIGDCVHLCVFARVGCRHVFYVQKEMRHRLIDSACSTFKTPLYS